MHRSAIAVVGAARRATPPPLVPQIVRVRLRQAYRDPAMWDRARAEMRFLLEESVPGADIEDAARRYIERWVWRAELRWRPRMITRQRVVGLEHLQRARSLGRGVLLSFMHHGQYDGAMPSVIRMGEPMHGVGHPKLLSPDAPPSVRQHMRINSRYCTVHSTEIGARGIAELLVGGGTVALACDVPGRTPVEFAGRKLVGSAGSARIPFATGSPVVLLRTRRDAHGSYLELSEGLDPHAYAGPEALLADILRRHEVAVLEWPEAADSPLSRWGTPDTAAPGAGHLAPPRAVAVGADGWSR